MNIITGITQEIMQKLHEEATKSVPSQHNFIINIDEERHNAVMYCYVIYDEIGRNPMTGRLEYHKPSKKTVNEIVVDKFNNLEKILELKDSRIFKVDNKDYYLGGLEKINFKKDNRITLIAINTNNF